MCRHGAKLFLRKSIQTFYSRRCCNEDWGKAGRMQSNECPHATLTIEAPIKPSYCPVNEHVHSARSSSMELWSDLFVRLSKCIQTYIGNILRVVGRDNLFDIAPWTSRVRDRSAERRTTLVWRNLFNLLYGRVNQTNYLLTTDSCGLSQGSLRARCNS